MRILEFVNATAVSVICPVSAAFAHGERPGHIDEGPDPGTWVTISMVLAWILIALMMVFLVRRLIRRQGSKGHARREKEKASASSRQS